MLLYLIFYISYTDIGQTKKLWCAHFVTLMKLKLKQIILIVANPGCTRAK